MNQYEAAFFYGDYSVIREEITKLLYENIEDTNPHKEKFALEVDTKKAL